METMLRVYFLQQWFDLSDPKMEDMLYDSTSMRRFARVDLGEDTVPDKSTILRFRHLLEQHQLARQNFAAVRALLEEHKLLLKAGAIVDATIIAAPSSTKNATATRDPEMRQTKKGNQWYVGMKLHVGTDTRGVDHAVTVTDAAQADITQMDVLVRGSETTLYSDKAYWRASDWETWQLPGDRHRINERGPRTPRRDAGNRAPSRGVPTLCALQRRGHTPIIAAIRRG